MEIKITYPPRKRLHQFKNVCRRIYNIIFLLALIVCPLINIWLQGTAWSVIVIFSLYLVWSSFVSPSLYELNRTYQSIKLFLDVLILLILVNVIFSRGWGLTVIPIVAFGGLIICSTLFFSDFQRQKHNAVPFVLVALLCLGAGLFGMFSELVETKWMYVVLASLSLAALVVSLVFLRKTVWQDLKKQLNAK